MEITSSRTLWFNKDVTFYNCNQLCPQYQPVFTIFGRWTPQEICNENTQLAQHTWLV